MSEQPAFLELPDLACDAVGGAAIACNDEFFAEKENLLRERAAEWREHEYTDRGKWMDGWETRRRRDAGHDWCVVRLGMPGVIRGVVVDTAFFRGNFPESCALYACEIDEPLDLAALATATWTSVLPRTQLTGNAKNAFAIESSGFAGARTDAERRGAMIECPQRFTHVRLDIFPDGGVARLRVHGEVAPNWARLRALGGPIDLAALEHGAWVESCSDMFFGSRNNLIKPGPSRSMADGWETRRRRGPGNDWANIRLACAGTIDRLEVDTTHFKGNAPGHCIVDGASEPDAWRMLLASQLQPHTRQVFDRELRRIGPITHLRLAVFPDGGVARLRAWGTPTREPSPGLDRLNAMPPLDATAALLRCCGSSRWTAAMVGARPFEDAVALARIAERVWWSLGEADYLEAFGAHPKIGEASAAKWSQQEQAGAGGATSETLAALVEANREYADKHGFIYIVCASGRSADEMLADVQARKRNSRELELRRAAEEQAQITRLRLAKLLEELAR